MSSTSENDTVERRLTQVVERLGIPSSTLQITQVRLNRLGTEPDIDDDRMDEVAAAALALSSREDGLPVSERDIAEAWSTVLAEANIEGDVGADQLVRQLTAVADYLDLGEPPAHPGDLIREFGERLGMADRLIEVAQRILHDSFDTDETVVAGGTSPAGTAGAALFLAAEINELDDEYDQADLGDVSDTSEVTVRNRYREIRDLLGEERLAAARYQLNGDEDSQPTGSQATAATDGNGETAATTGGSADTREPDDTGQTSSSSGTASAGTSSSSSSGASTSSTADTVSAVEDEIDALTDELDVSPSTRLFARGMVGDAVDGVTVEDAPKLAAATLVAGARIEDKELDAADIADNREFETRSITHFLDHLETAVDVEIPRLSASEIVDKLVDELDLSEEVREESALALEQYRADEIDADYTAAELGAGAVFFAATVGRTQVDIADLADITGASAEYVTNAMNSVVVSLCLSLVRGDIDYDECSWTTDLLESELSPDIGDSYTGRVIAIAKTYTAGREHQHIDDATLDVVLHGE